ncbi:hypothetical protein, partial [Asticcacaulis sp. AC460]|uniref:hypothetical protein n=1 Tax=Asticcacaulis sp. AC460 TaxID=1282360 RepID=UPI00054FAC5C
VPMFTVSALSVYFRIFLAMFQSPFAPSVGADGAWNSAVLSAVYVARAEIVFQLLQWRAVVRKAPAALRPGRLSL